MSGDNRRVVNPLLNASVTGATIEDYLQHTVLLPAVEIATTPTHSTPESSNPIETQNQIIQEERPRGSPLYTLTPDITAPGDIIAQAIGDQNTLQSVFNSFSSLLNLTSTEPKPPSPIPSIVDSIISLTPSSTTLQPIPLYSPTDQELGPTLYNQHQPPQVNTLPAAQGLVNNYRRTSTKRPTYVPIPGLSSAVPPVTQTPLLLRNISRSPHSPPAAFTARKSPLPNTYANSANYYQPELSGYASPLQPNVIEQSPLCTPPVIQPIALQRTIERCKPSSVSPFLHPVSPSELNLIAPPSLTNTTSSASLSSNYNFDRPQPNFVTAGMSSVREGRVSPPVLSTTSFQPPQEPEQRVNSGIEGHSYVYRPVYHHWFFKKQSETKAKWIPFTMVDSLNLEKTYLSADLSPDNIVATDGSRYDVNILRRERRSAYWTSEPNEVRRCSWFRKGMLDGRYVPYEENVAATLEKEFKIAFEQNVWNRKVELATGETIVFHGPDVLVLFPQAQSPDAWGNTPNQTRPRVVKRGMDEFHIEEGEPNKVDHLLFLVHGIGSVCDLKFRSVEEVVDEFRSISSQLVEAHYHSSCEKGEVNRVEVLPISWHGKLHSDDTGVDKKLKGITLESIPKLRNFSNDTILDVLFYTSPVYCQTIISSVGNDLNSVFEKFKQRNPGFTGGVSLGGHSLGSLILFDILCHQHPEKKNSESISSESEDVVSPLKPDPKQRKISRRISYMMSAIGTGQPQLNYPQLSFNPKHFFALGSPIGMFVTVRGLDTLGEQFSLPTCPNFFNIFHPYDPVAYRIESLVNPELATLKPVLIAHHKGRKRMHLELKETMARVGADLKQRLMESMKSTWNSFYQFSLFKTQREPPNLEEEVDKVLEEQLKREEAQTEQTEDLVLEAELTDLSLGILNQGRRIDYVLQEAPLEFINEYLFALQSHVCYWESEDSMLLILKEIYNSMNISTDNQIPQQTMTIERPSSPNTSRNEYVFGLDTDPTLTMTPRTDIGPPPTQGFIKKL